MKDDKSPLYIIITKSNFPRVLTARKSDIEAGKVTGFIFGPYASALQVKFVLRSIRKIFPYCNATEKQRRIKKPCFYYHLGLCSGACVGKISKTDYRDIINNLRLFLKGKRSSVTQGVTKRMHQASRSKHFEEAAKWRDQLQAIDALQQQRNFALRYSSTQAPSNLARKELWKTIAPFVIRSGCQLPDSPFKRIEAYDVSNISGTSATASMIVFTDGTPDKNQYRKFKIRLKNEPDDSMMLAEAISRRLNHREWTFPELMVIDGGKGQVQIIKKVLASKGLHHRIPVIGLAKRNEEIIVHKQTFHAIRLRKVSSALRLLMHMRDEAHRFARVYHHILRERKLFEAE